MYGAHWDTSGCAENKRGLGLNFPSKNTNLSKVNAVCWPQLLSVSFLYPLILHTESGCTGVYVRWEPAS